MFTYPVGKFEEGTVRYLPTEMKYTLSSPEIDRIKLLRISSAARVIFRSQLRVKNVNFFLILNLYDIWHESDIENFLNKSSSATVRYFRKFLTGYVHKPALEGANGIF